MMGVPESGGQVGRWNRNNADAESVRHNPSPNEAYEAYTVAARDPFRAAQEVEPSSRTIERIPPHSTTLPHSGEEHVCACVYPSHTPPWQVDHTRGRTTATPFPLGVGLGCRVAGWSPLRFGFC